jgi:hypothetical protein
MGADRAGGPAGFGGPRHGGRPRRPGEGYGSYPHGDGRPYPPGGPQYGPGAAPYGPGQQRMGTDPYAPGSHPYGPRPRQPGPGQPGPGQYGPGPMGPGPAGYGRPGGGPGHPGLGQQGQGHGPGQHGPGAGQAPGAPGQGPARDQRGPGTGGGLLGNPPRGMARPGGPGQGSWERAGGTVIRQRDSALPDRLPNAKGAAVAIEADNVAAFARDLRVLRSKADLDYLAMAEKSHYTMRTLASAAGGLRLPTLPVLIAYVRACGGDVTEWEERWGKLVKSKKGGQTALPAAGSNTSADEPGVTADGIPGGRGSGPGPVPPSPSRSNEVYVITSAKPRDERW